MVLQRQDVAGPADVNVVPCGDHRLSRGLSLSGLSFRTRWLPCWHAICGGTVSGIVMSRIAVRARRRSFWKMLRGGSYAADSSSYACMPIHISLIAWVGDRRRNMVVSGPVKFFRWFFSWDLVPAWCYPGARVFCIPYGCVMPACPARRPRAQEQ